MPVVSSDFLWVPVVLITVMVCLLADLFLLDCCGVLTGVPDVGLFELLKVSLMDICSETKYVAAPSNVSLVMIVLGFCEKSDGRRSGQDLRKDVGGESASMSIPLSSFLPGGIDLIVAVLCLLVDPLLVDPCGMFLGVLDTGPPRDTFSVLSSAIDTSVF